MRSIRIGLSLCLALGVAALGACAGAPSEAAAPAAVAPRTVVLNEGLSAPWGLAFLPDGRMLVTERGGRLALLPAGGRGAPLPVAGVPAVAQVGQGGLLDVAIDPDFARAPWIYLAYAEAGAGDTAGTVVIRARLDGTTLRDVAVLYRQTPKVAGPIHFGARFAFAPDRTLFVTLGERGQGRPAQDPATSLGKVVRIGRDGSIPADNPVFAGGLPGLWSIGHRNPQGAAIRPGTGELWVTEHGPQGGDELNRVRPGANYGWPNVSYGCNYGSPVGDGCALGGGTHAPAFVEPVSVWKPVSVAPSGLVFYTGDVFPQWKGDAFFGALAGTAVWRVSLSADGAETGRERLFGALGERVRVVVQGPEGYLYLLTDAGRLIQVRD
ncbi:MAG: hypothetical protein RJA99_2990 [Pseudomonadota bacterium]|jgi:glucose/arabinose dehydrogenase